MLEDYESDIEDWFWKMQGVVPLSQFLCQERVLKGADQQCLAESLTDRPPVTSNKEELWAGAAGSGTSRHP